MEQELINKVLAKAKKDKEVVAVALFGSSLDGKGRDIDICLFLDKKYSNIQMSKKKLTYYTSDKLDIQIFQQLPLYVRARILKKNKVLLNKNHKKLYNLAVETIKEFGFYKKMYDYFLEETING
jgi:uncharacterized protein